MFGKFQNGLAILLLPLMVVTAVFAWLSAPVAGIALLIEGEWEIILLGLGTAVVVPWIFALASLPNMALISIEGFFISLRGPLLYLFYPISFIFAILSSLYPILLIYFISSACFIYLPDISGVDGRVFLDPNARYWYVSYDWPVLLWVYGVISSSFSYMLSKEHPDNFVSIFGTLSAMVLSLIFAIVFFFELSVHILNISVIAWLLTSLLALLTYRICTIHALALFPNRSTAQFTG